jgi:flagellar biosynthesis chaperone FliJ
MESKTKSLPLSQKDFWLQAYIAALHRLDHELALVEADRALEACNQRWMRISKKVQIWTHLSDCPVGTGEWD